MTKILLLCLFIVSVFDTCYRANIRIRNYGTMTSRAVAPCVNNLYETSSELAIVMPTYNERDNIEDLVVRLDRALFGVCNQSLIGRRNMTFSGLWWPSFRVQKPRTCLRVQEKLINWLIQKYRLIHRHIYFSENKVSRWDDFSYLASVNRYWLKGYNIPLAE